MKKKLLLLILCLAILIPCSYFGCKVYARDEKQTLEEGIYEIETGVDSNQV